MGLLTLSVAGPADAQSVPATRLAPTLPGISAPAPAQGMMRHMTVVPSQNQEIRPQTPIQPPAASPAPAAEEPHVPVRKRLTPETALKKPSELQDWSQLNAVLLMSGPDEVEKMVRIVEADPGAVPPQALFFLAKGLADIDRMEDAAVYYYVGQLRLAFDSGRWPPRPEETDIRRQEAERKKTEDQRSQIPQPGKRRLKDPHSGVSAIAATIGAPITQWMLEDPTRADTVMTKVQAWDESAPYAYKPGYDVPKPVAFDDWPRLLEETRRGFYQRIGEFVTGLKKLKTDR